MENKYDLYRQGSSGWTWKMRNEEFQEEDVWGVLTERKDSDSKAVMGSSKEPSFMSRRLPTATRMIATSINKNPIPQEPKIFQQSAPVNIPDWSKIYGTSSKNSSSWLAPDSDGDGNGRWESEDEYEEEEEEEEEEEDNRDGDGDGYGDGDGGGNVIPPHEYIAKRLARSQTWSFSVCEGAGRTLKGRDLSRVRNAVLSKTGFLEFKSDW